MQRKCDKRREYYAGNNKTDQKLIHQHMSNHYRRILNAKKAVDNSPPYCFKLRRPLSGKPSGGGNKANRGFENLPLSDRSLSTNSNKDSWAGESHPSSSRYHANCVPEWPPKQNNLDLIDRITFDTKNGPGTYSYIDWLEEKVLRREKPVKSNFGVQQKSSEEKSFPNTERTIRTVGLNDSVHKRKFVDQKKAKPSGAAAKGSKSFPSLAHKVNSKINVQAVSKLRSLRVYHPPRRKESRNKSENSVNEQISSNLEAPNCKFTKICACDDGAAVLKKISFNTKEQSLTSSRDSAYNGGASSTIESRSPTPDQRRKKECSCSCCCCEKKQKEGGLPSTSESPVQTQEQQSFSKMQEDALYVKFIQDITTEILDKKLYTNKALKKVMKEHVKNNLKSLQKDRMLKEVENLRIQLGIPEDKTLLDVESKCKVRDYPVIWDSEFCMQKCRDEAKSPKKMPRSISEVLSPEGEGETMASCSETEDLISVIQVTKTVRERRKEKSIEETPMVIVRCNSSDDSDRPSDPKKRSIPKSRKQKFSRSISSSSSESEGPLNFSSKVQEKTEFGSKETSLGSFAEKSSFLNKKSRSVRFWKNSDLGLKPTLEIKQKTFSRGGESTSKVKHD